MRIPKIFWSSKSDNFKSFKSYFESFKWLEKVFYSSSFFCEFLFLISSHTEIPLTFTRECQLSISPPHPRAIATPQKWGPHRRTPKNIGVNFPLVMGCTPNFEIKVTILLWAFPIILYYLTDTFFCLCTQNKFLYPTQSNVTLCRNKIGCT